MRTGRARVVIAMAVLGVTCQVGCGSKDDRQDLDVLDAATEAGDTLLDVVPADTGREAIDNARVAINEVVNKADSGPDWIELTNPGDASVDLAGWILKDSDDTHVFRFPANTAIDPGAFLIVQGQGGTSGLVTTFGLGKADSVRLFDPTGTLVDTISWVDGDAPQGTSLGRCPDGRGSFFRLATPTQGTANACR